MAVETEWSLYCAQLEIRVMESWSRKGADGRVEAELYSFVDGKS